MILLNIVLYLTTILFAKCKINSSRVISNKQFITTPILITRLILSQHDTLDDCWVVFRDNVYDLSEWVYVHPGGSNVYVELCGTENFENEFIKTHGLTKYNKFLNVTTFKGTFI
jgi:cytochrome b involved in lipid metabolism